MLDQTRDRGRFDDCIMGSIGYGRPSSMMFEWAGWPARDVLAYFTKPLSDACIGTDLRVKQGRLSGQSGSLVWNLK
jgi:hypothetical protein